MCKIVDVKVGNRQVKVADKLSEFDDFLQRYDILYDNPKNYKSVFLVKTGGAS